MKFLVTGATGFIGQAVVNDALAKGFEVVALTRSLEKAKAIFPANPNLHITESLEGVDCKKAIHLAWADVANYAGENNLEENINFQKEFVDKLIAAGITDLTVAGTCLEYGKTEGECSEDMKIDKLYTPYAEAKTELCNYLLKKDIKLKWGRVFYVYGVGSRSNSLLSQLLKAIKDGDKEFNMSKGDQKRDFIHIETLANNIVATAAQDEVVGVINWGNGKAKTVLEFVQKILELKNAEIKLNNGYYPYPEYEAFEFWADINKLKNIKGIKFDDKIWL